MIIAHGLLSVRCRHGVYEQVVRETEESNGHTELLRDSRDSSGSGRRL
jgi:hypothetical protein